MKLLLTALSHRESIMKGALCNQGSYVVFLCCNQWKLWGTQITTQSIRNGLPSPPMLVKVCPEGIWWWGREGGGCSLSHAISFGMEQWNLQNKDHFLFSSNMETINLERVTSQRLRPPAGAFHQRLMGGQNYHGAHKTGANLVINM